MCLSKEGYSKETTMNAIRRSFKGEPANVMMSLGPGNSIDEILQKFDSIYGNVLGIEYILAEFYRKLVRTVQLGVLDWRIS